jgi:hypothetical protein
MDEKGQSAFGFGDNYPDNMSFPALLQQRRKVLGLFLNNPVDTFHQYPDFGLELITFFSRSSNPHLDQVTGQSVLGRELDFENWEAAKAWSLIKLEL